MREHWPHLRPPWLDADDPEPRWPVAPARMGDVVEAGTLRLFVLLEFVDVGRRRWRRSAAGRPRRPRQVGVQPGLVSERPGRSWVTCCANPRRSGAPSRRRAAADAVCDVYRAAGRPWDGLRRRRALGVRLAALDLMPPASSCSSRSLPPTSRGPWTRRERAARRAARARHRAWIVRLDDATCDLVADHTASMALAFRLEQAALAASDVLAARRRRHLVLKGCALATAVYPDPSRRPFGDVDLLLDPRGSPRHRRAAGAGAIRAIPEVRRGPDGASPRTCRCVRRRWRRPPPHAHRRAVRPAHPGRGAPRPATGRRDRRPSTGHARPRRRLRPRRADRGRGRCAGPPIPSDMVELEATPHSTRTPSSSGEELGRRGPGGASGHAAGARLGPTSARARSPWARATSPLPIDRFLMRCYLGSARSYRRQLVEVAFVSTWRERAAPAPLPGLAGSLPTRVARWTGGRHVGRAVRKLPLTCQRSVRPSGPAGAPPTGCAPPESTSDDTAATAAFLSLIPSRLIAGRWRGRRGGPPPDPRRLPRFSSRARRRIGDGSTVMVRRQGATRSRRQQHRPTIIAVRRPYGGRRCVASAVRRHGPSGDDSVAPPAAARTGVRSSPALQSGSVATGTALRTVR